jgi:hypothetical protein
MRALVGAGRTAVTWPLRHAVQARRVQVSAVQQFTGEGGSAAADRGLKAREASSAPQQQR